MGIPKERFSIAGDNSANECNILILIDYCRMQPIESQC